MTDPIEPLQELARLIEKWRELESLLPALEEAIAKHERLAGAAALREAAELERSRASANRNVKTRITAQESHTWCAEVLEALIPPADQKALDAHDAEVRDRALEEAEQECFNPYWQSDSTRAVATRIRALRGSK